MQPPVLIAIIILIMLFVALIISGAPHLLAVPRQYLFKLAILNTIGLAIPTTAVVVLLGTVGGRWLQRSTRGWRIVQLVPLAVLSVALLVPSAITTVRRSLQSILLESPINGLIAIGVVYVLILLPVVIWLMLFNPHLTSPRFGEGQPRGDPSSPNVLDLFPPFSEAARGGLGRGKIVANPKTLPQQSNPHLTSPSLGEGQSRDIPSDANAPDQSPLLSEAGRGGLGRGQNVANSTRVYATCICLLFILLNPITPLLLTGGEPYNRTHLWSSWAFTNAYVAHSHGQAAAMILWMVPLLLGVGVIAWLVKRA